MAQVYKWSGVGVAVQSALGANKTITGITTANPGVVTSASHGLTSGDIVVLSVLGMNQLNDRVVRVDDEDTNTFELEGVDTSAYDTFVSGTANEVTFGTTLSTLVDLNASGGDFDFIDITTIHDTVRSQIPGTASPASYSFTSLWDPADAGLIALAAAAAAQAKRAIRFSWPNGARLYFNGYVGATGLPTGTAQNRVETPVTMTMQGRATFYPPA
jgi:hypothetical protein